MIPSYQHEYACGNLIAALKGVEKYSVFAELTLFIEKEYIPDICLYPKRKVEFGAEDIIRMTEMPVLAVEVLSPSQTTQDVLEKFTVFSARGSHRVGSSAR